MAQAAYYFRKRGFGMNPGVSKTDRLAKKGNVRRTNRRLNGMGTQAGFPDPPRRGQLTRTLALIDAALRVWEASRGRHPAGRWRHGSH